MLLSGDLPLVAISMAHAAPEWRKNFVEIVVSPIPFDIRGFSRESM